MRIGKKEILGSITGLFNSEEFKLLNLNNLFNDASGSNIKNLGLVSGINSIEDSLVNLDGINIIDSEKYLLSSKSLRTDLTTDIKILLHGNGGYNDSSVYNHVMSSHPNMGFTTADKVFGSAAFDFTGDNFSRIVYDYTSDFNMGTKNWIFATHLKMLEIPETNGGPPLLISYGTNNNQPFIVMALGVDGSDFFLYYESSPLNDDRTIIESSRFSIDINVYHWYAIRRNGAYLEFYVDGNLISSSNIGIDFNVPITNFPYVIGINDAWPWVEAPGFSLNGYMDEIILKIGDDTYTDYQVPSEEYVDTPYSGFIIYGKNNSLSIIPEKVDILFVLEEIDSITLNTDLKIYATRNNGITVTQGILSQTGITISGLKILRATIDLTSQSSDSNLSYKIQSFNGKNFKIHNPSMSWK